MNEFRLGTRAIGTGQPCYVIAEVGSNHDRDLDTAFLMIDIAAEAGVDAVKFQTYTGRALYSRNTPHFEYLRGITSQPPHELLDDIALPRDWQPLLAQRCRDHGVHFLSTPFDLSALAELDVLDVPAIKVASFEITDLPFLGEIGRVGRPVILSTGMATMDEIEEAIQVLHDAGSSQVTLLQCASLYPARPEVLNLRAIVTMRERFAVPTGLSDHTLGIHLAVAGVALGASILEKHFTLDRRRKGPDHSFAIEPDELVQLVHEVRDVEVALGDGHKVGPSSLEAVEMYRNARRSVVATRAIRAGTAIDASMLTTKRPGFGIPPKDLPTLIGRVARADIAEDDILTWDLF